MLQAWLQCCITFVKGRVKRYRTSANYAMRTAIELSCICRYPASELAWPCNIITVDVIITSISHLHQHHTRISMTREPMQIYTLRSITRWGVHICTLHLEFFLSTSSWKPPGNMILWLGDRPKGVYKIELKKILRRQRRAANICCLLLFLLSVLKFKHRFPWLRFVFTLGCHNMTSPAVGANPSLGIASDIDETNRLLVKRSLKISLHYSPFTEWKPCWTNSR